MSEQDLVKGLIDSGIIAILVAYIFRLDNQRTANEAQHRTAVQDGAAQRAEDNNRWLAVFAQRAAIPTQEFSSRSPTKLE